MKFEVEKLVRIYKEHGSIVVGLDFDNTIFPLSDDIRVELRCDDVRALIHKIRPKIKLCLWTVAADWSLKYKVVITEELYSIELDAINASTMYDEPDSIRKPFFNLLLDDNAGLDEAMSILREFDELTDEN